MWNHPNAPAIGGPWNHIAPQPYPHGSQVDPWAQTWVRPIGGPPGSHPPAVMPPPGMRLPAPGYPSMAAPRGNSPRKWVLVGGAAAAAVALTVGAGLLIAVADKSSAPAGTTTVSESPTPAPAAPTMQTPTATQAPVVPIDALPGLLLDPAAVNAIEGTSGMEIRPDPNAGSGSGFSDIKTDRPECQGLQHPAMVAALQGSGWISAQTQVLREPAEDWKHLVSNAVVNFPTAQLAGDYATAQAQAWARCAGKSLTSTAAGEQPVTWTVGSTSNRDGTVSVLLTQEGAAGWGCQRAMAVRDNIVIDTRSCGFNRTDQAVAIATKIADRVHVPS
ncbi:sensor domain-containing protein [Mycobacterium sp. 050134]|uniref:sensor domain-containing protein n=1 Tax=Mycobacterium sp. 050134 TaxID=3096111 RepID=UPI002ED84F47